MHAINEKLGARGATLRTRSSRSFTQPTDQTASLRELIDGMQRRQGEQPADHRQQPRLSPRPRRWDSLRHSSACALQLDAGRGAERNERCDVWGVPMAHAWEAWSDARAYDGTATILQPQALPLYRAPACIGCGAVHEPGPTSSLDVQATWNSRLGGDFAQAWHDALANGVVPDTASPKANVSLRADAGRHVRRRRRPNPLTILFRPDPHLWDGRYANNAWLQELPRPLTKLTWDNPLLISPEQAEN